MEALIRAALRRHSRMSAILTALASALLAALAGIALAKLGSFQHQVKAMLAIVAVIAMVVAALKPDIGLVMLLALMPFELHVSGVGSDEVVILALAAVLVWRIEANRIPGWLALGGLALVLGSLLAAIHAQDPGSALWGSVRWLGALIVLFAAVSILRDRRDASRRMISIFVGSAVLVVIFAYIQKAGIYAIVGAPYLAGHPSSFFAFYTNYAGYAAMAATLATGEILASVSERRVARAAIFGAALVFILSGIAISASRGGLLALGGGWLLLLVLNLRRGSVIAQALIVLAIFAGAAYLATPRSTILTLQQRLSTPLGSQGEDKTRFALQKVGQQALETHPLGLGFGNFAGYLQRNVHNFAIQTTFAHAHRTPVQIGLDAGWLGLGGFLLLLGTPFVLVMRRSRRYQSVIPSTFVAALGGFMAQGMFDYLLFEIAFLIFFVAMIWGTVHSIATERFALAAEQLAHAEARDELSDFQSTAPSPQRARLGGRQRAWSGS